MIQINARRPEKSSNLLYSGSFTVNGVGGSIAFSGGPGDVELGTRHYFEVVVVLEQFCVVTI